MKGRIIIFSIVGCPFCIRAKGYLDQLGLQYIEVNLDNNSEARKQVIEITGKKTVPQIFFNEKFVGGYDTLSNLSKDELDKLVKYVEQYEAPEGAPDPSDWLSSEENGTRDPMDFYCELDEYSLLTKELRDSGIVKDHKKNLKTYKNSFIGKEAVDWLVKYKNLERTAAIEMCKQLVGRHFGHNVRKNDIEEFKDDSSIYQFVEDIQGSALNAGLKTQCEPRPASELGEELRQLILSIYNSHLSSDGKKVDYKSISEDDRFKVYLNRTAELQRVNVEDASREEKLAFFINVYNALVIHAFVVVGPPVNMWQRYKFFNTVSYIIGGYNYSLNEIENGILRSNRKALGAFRKPFGKNDPRLKIALEKCETRVHFALVCGAKSCPPIKTYSVKEVDSLLKLSTESFLEGDGVEVDIKKREVRVSPILKWYREDFGSNKQEVLQYVHANMGNCEKKAQIGELLTSGAFKLGYLKYDWSVNSK